MMPYFPGSPDDMARALSGQQLVGDVVPLQISPLPSRFGTPGANAPQSQIADYNRLLGHLRALGAQKMGVELPSASVITGPWAK